MTARGASRAERNAVANLKAQRLQPCGRCGQRIDYSLEHPDPGSFSAGHIKPWISHPELRADPANLRPEHLRCNQGAGDGPGAPSLGATSETW